MAILSKKCSFNFKCIVLDVCEIRIGDFSLFGPAVQVYTATHLMNAELRRTQEFAKPDDIGSDVWIGEGAINCPGVRIGAGSVVTRTIPASVFAAGKRLQSIPPPMSLSRPKAPTCQDRIYFSLVLKPCRR